MATSPQASQGGDETTEFFIYLAMAAALLIADKRRP